MFAQNFSKNFLQIYETAIEFNNMETIILQPKSKPKSKPKTQPKVYLPNDILSHILSFHSCPQIQHKREFKCCLSKIRQFHYCNTELQTEYQIKKHLYYFRRKHFLRHFKQFHGVEDPCKYDFKELDCENYLIEETIQEGKGRRWRDLDDWLLSNYYNSFKTGFNSYDNILFIDNSNKKGIEVELNSEFETEFCINLYNDLYFNERYNIHYKKKDLPIVKMTTSKDGVITMVIEESRDYCKRRIKFKFN